MSTEESTTGDIILPVCGQCGRQHAGGSTAGCPPAPVVESAKLVEFTEEAVMQYLDDSIGFWRLQRRWPQMHKGINTMQARHYVDAFQSMRMHLFGEALP